MVSSFPQANGKRCTFQFSIFLLFFLFLFLFLFLVPFFVFSPPLILPSPCHFLSVHWWRRKGFSVGVLVVFAQYLLT